MLFPAKIKVGLAGLAVAGGAAIAVAAGVGPAVGQVSVPIQVQVHVKSPGTLVAKGAGVHVSVSVECSPSPDTGFLVVGLTESVAKKIAYGWAEESVPCTGTSETFDLLVLAGSTGPSGIPGGPSKPFAKGVAIANANFGACAPTGNDCATRQIYPTIKIRK